MSTRDVVAGAFMSLSEGLGCSDDVPQPYWDKLERRTTALFAMYPDGDEPTTLTVAELDAWRPPPSAFLTLSELRDLPEPDWLIPGLVPQGSVGYITGRDGAYKTFLALDLALHLVTLRRWHGRGLDFAGWGRALFVAGEGVRSFPERIEAWSAHHKAALSPWQEQSLVVRNGAVDLFTTAAAYDELLAKVKELRPDLIVIDTLARSTGKADQNSASDMSVVTARLAALRSAGGDACTVLVIAHTDKGDHDARGSSSIEDDADFVLHCKADDGRLRVRVAKMKDGDSGYDLDFAMRRVGGSLVLDEPTRDGPRWLSDDATNRVRAVLFGARHLDPLTVAQVVSQVKEDSTNKPINRTTVYRVLGAMKVDGDVIGEKLGASAERYRLDPERIDATVWEMG